jgi:lipopolysaccharide/colanic/teichoic acid biosynthesis glycosyltransferase
MARIAVADADCYASSSAGLVSRAAKRALDIVIAGPLLLLTIPVICAAAAAVFVVDGRPVLFSQRRAGLNGSSFHLLKIRTMWRDSEARLADVLESDTARRQEFDRYLCLRNDPRVLPHVGWLLRRTSLDELPQLLNVLVGSMSLVGPRPLSRELLDRFPLDHVDARQRVKPGLTGLWQINGRSTNELADWIRLDDHYLRSRSFGFDLGILLRTPYALFSRIGAN